MTLTFPWHKTFKTVAITTLLLVPAISLGVPKALTDEDYESVTFTIENGTDEIIMEFYASPRSADDWEEDILGDDVLAPGDQVNIEVDDNREDCTYDFLAVFEDDTELVHENISVCAGETYVYE